MIHALLIASFAALQVPAGSWKEMNGSATGGGVSNTPGSYSQGPSLAMDPSGRPVLAWYDNASGKYQVYLRRWDGASWVEYVDGYGNGSASGAGISGAAKNVTAPSLALDAAGSPVVAWSDDNSPEPNVVGGRILLRRWKAATREWVGMEPGSQFSIVSGAVMTSATLPSLALDAAGGPVVTWSDSTYTSNPQIYLRRWNGTAWVGAGGSDASFRVSSDDVLSARTPSVALDAAGRPAVLWSWTSPSSPAGLRFYLWRWDGSAWTEWGGSAAGVGISTLPLSMAGSKAENPCFALDAAGSPFVAWADNSTGSHEIYLRRWNPAAQAWQGMDGASAPSLVSSPGPYSGNWKTRYPSLALDAAGRPVLAWVQRTNATGSNYDIYLRRWNSSFKAWEELAGSATDGGVSSSDMQSFSPSLKLDAGGYPVVAWREAPIVPDVAGFLESDIFLRRCLPPPAPPFDPALLAQVRLDGTSTIPNGGSAPGGGFRVRASVGDPDPDDLVQLQVEVRPVGTAFDGSGTGAAFTTGAAAAPGSTAEVIVTGLEGEVTYHWQVRAIDTRAMKSAWAASPDGFTTPYNAAAVVTTIRQVETRDHGIVRALTIEAVVVDPDSSGPVTLELEIRPLGEAFSGIATEVGARVESGASIEIPVLRPDGSYCWRYQSRDGLGRAGGWTRYGANPDSEADFVLVPAGSAGTAACLASASMSWSSAGLALLVLSGAALLPRRA